MKRDDFIGGFPMWPARGNGKPGHSTCVNLFMRVHSDGFGFLMPEPSGHQPYPVRDEEAAVEVFRLLWRRAQSEAPKGQADDEQIDGEE